MYEITKYVCEVDGKEFEAESECQKYELELKYGGVIKNNEVQLWDEEFQPLSITDIEHSLDHAIYFKCLTKEAVRYLAEMSEDSYDCVPDARDIHLGEIYVYDEFGEEFIPFSEFAENVIQIAKHFNLKLEE